jgi:hypothetical protein
MRKAPFYAVMFLALLCAAAAAAELHDMIGKWRWQEYTIEVTECQASSICATIVAGPKNVGMKIFASKLVAKGGNLFGKIVHPETREIYNTRFQRVDTNKWRLDGCTAARVCLSGEFVRVK